MGTIECSQPASKSSWDSQDFGDIIMVLKMAHGTSPPGHDELIEQSDTKKRSLYAAISFVYDVLEKYKCKKNHSADSSFKLSGRHTTQT